MEIDIRRKYNVNIIATKKIGIFLSAIMCIGLVSCGNRTDNNHEGSQPALHDRTKWFTAEELMKKGLDELTMPSGLFGEINSSDAWFNDGYSFSQDCPDEATFKSNAETYFLYFKTHYDGRFGKPAIEKLSLDTNETWYVIEQKSELSDYFDDNPSKLYQFYYVRDNTLENGYFVKGSVWIFEIRYEIDTETNQYKFKLFVESADSSTNGVYSNYYKMK